MANPPRPVSSPAEHGELLAEARRAATVRWVSDRRPADQVVSHLPTKVIETPGRGSQAAWLAPSRLPQE